MSSKKKKKKNSNYRNGQAAPAKDAKKKKISKETLTKIIVAAVIFVALVAIITACSVISAKNNTKYAKISVEGFGDIVVQLDAKTAPITVANFLKLANEGFYDGLTFHRIIDEFMIQGGDPDADGSGNSDENIKGEFSSNGVENDISHLRGVISMARSNAYDSASCQFFICNADATYLDGDYAAFGHVIAGMDVVDAITEYGIQYTTNGVIKDVTLQPVISSVTELTKSEALRYVD